MAAELLTRTIGSQRDAAAKLAAGRVVAQARPIQPLQQAAQEEAEAQVSVG